MPLGPNQMPPLLFACPLLMLLLLRLLLPLKLLPRLAPAPTLRRSPMLQAPQGPLLVLLLLAGGRGAL